MSDAQVSSLAPVHINHIMVGCQCWRRSCKCDLVLASRRELPIALADCHCMQSDHGYVVHTSRGVSIGLAPIPKIVNEIRKEKRRKNSGNKSARLDRLLDLALDASSPLVDMDQPLRITGSPSAGRLDWSAMGATCDPTQKLGLGVRGRRKRETIEAFAYLLENVLLPRVRANSRGAPDKPACKPTIIDAGCSTGSLLLPLAFAFPEAHFVGVDLKQQSLALLRERARAAGLSDARVSTCECRIEDYNGPCDAIVSLHACGGASDATLQLAARRAPSGARAVPFAVSPCCVGAVALGNFCLGGGVQGTGARGAASTWLLGLLRRAASPSPSDEAGERGSSSSCSPSSLDGAASGADLFALLTASADASASLGLEGDAATRQRRAKRVVEVDRLAAMPGEGLGGRLMTIRGETMAATSSLTDVLVGPPDLWPESPSP